MIVDRGWKNTQNLLVYALGKPIRKALTSHKIAGIVGADLCENCGRIVLRAIP